MNNQLEPNNLTNSQDEVFLGAMSAPADYNLSEMAERLGIADLEADDFDFQDNTEDSTEIGEYTNGKRKYRRRSMQSGIYAGEKVQILDQQFPDLVPLIPEILIRIFGRNKDLAFYQQKARELAYLFGATQDEHTRENWIRIEDFRDINIPEIPTADFEDWANLRNFFEQIDWYKVRVIDLLYKVSKMDARLAVALAYCFKLMPQYKSQNDFIEAMGSTQILRSGVPNALQVLVQNFDSLGADVKRYEAVFYVREFLGELADFDTTKLLRFIDGTFIGYNTSTYRLAKLIAEQQDIPFDLLSKNQQKIVQIFRSYYKKHNLFPKSDDLVRELNLAPMTLLKHINRILSIMENSEGKNFYRTSNGKIIELDDDRVLAKLFTELSANPEIAQSPNLSDLQRQCLAKLVELRETAGTTFPGLGTVAKKLKLDHRKVRHLMEQALESIKKPQVYYEKTGEQLQARDIRVQLIAKGGLEYVSGLNARSRNIKMISLLLETAEGTQTFKYTVAEVAALMGIKTKNPGGSVYHVIRNILSGENDFDATLADTEGVALTRNHLRVVELLLEFGVTETLQNIQPEWYLGVVYALLETDEHGRYYSYDVISNRFNTESSVLTDVIKRIISILEQQES